MECNVILPNVIFSLVFVTFVKSSAAAHGFKHVNCPVQSVILRMCQVSIVHFYILHIYTQNNSRTLLVVT